MTYRVTQQDIDAGIRGSRLHCPIAHAIRRRHQTSRVGMNIFTAHIGDRVYRLPHRVSMWICYYDQGQEVAPFKFMLLSPTR